MGLGELLASAVINIKIIYCLTRLGAGCIKHGAWGGELVKHDKTALFF
jgi:hypothetical protein